MSEIHECLTVLCPFYQVPQAVEAYVTSLPVQDGSPVVAMRVQAGDISVEEMTGNFCRLDLDGAYVPPLGLAGAVFDSVVGHHIALAAARELLDEIKTGMELAFQTGAAIA